MSAQAELAAISDDLARYRRALELIVTPPPSVADLVDLGGSGGYAVYANLVASLALNPTPEPSR